MRGVDLELARASRRRARCGAARLERLDQALEVEHALADAVAHGREVRRQQRREALRRRRGRRVASAAERRVVRDPHRAATVTDEVDADRDKAAGEPEADLRHRELRADREQRVRRAAQTVADHHRREASRRRWRRGHERGEQKGALP